MTAFVVRGAAGVGKSALLDQVVRLAPGRVLRARGVESGAVAPFTTAFELLLPLRALFPQLPAAQREALEAGPALRGGPAPLAMCAATLGVLTLAAEHTPLLVVVDDLQWVDPGSRQALMFTARRLAADPVTLLMAVRDEPAGPWLDLPTVDLGGLTVTGWVGAVRRLPERTRDALFVVAASRSSALGDLAKALAGLGLTLEDLAPAEAAGLVQEAGGTVVLRHPLLRQAILADVGDGARGTGYRALVEASAPEVRPWYRAAMTPAPDEAVAGELVTVAVAARRRAGYGASARAWHRAAEMTPDPATRARRLLEAATDATLAGTAGLAVPWCAEALAASSADVVLAADVELVRARARISAGRPYRARVELVAAAEGVLAADPGRAADLFAEAAMASAIAGDLRRSVELARRCEAAVPVGRRSLGALVMPVTAFLAAGDPAGTARLAHADRVVPIDGGVGDQVLAASLAQGLTWAQHYERAQLRVDAVVETARRTGAPLALAYGLAVRSDLETWTGRWPAAYADAEEALRWAEELGQVTWIGKSLDNLARLDAARGDGSLCRERTERAEREVLARGVDALRVYLPAVRGFCALGEDRPDDAVDHLEQALAAAAATGLHGPTVVPFAGDLLEALIRTGDTSRAERLLEELAERPGAYAAVVVARCRGRLAVDPGTAARCFARAHHLEARRHMPFERARTLLAEATTLRGLGHATAARTPLRDALAAFEMLGARPWAAQAAAQLVAVGGLRRPVPDGAGLETLTGPEVRIARAVAHGQSNVEVAATLFVSRKTVEGRLTSIYRKLGLRSRTELARLVADADPE